jgi:RpiB/LacA/LacB family sugar-phosphate isomerase
VSIALLENRADRGILICGSGVGASAANKLPGIRAGLCHDTYSAHQGVEHNDINMLVLGARVIGTELARELVRGDALRRPGNQRLKGRNNGTY